MDLQKAFHDAISHSIFSKIKTNNIIIDTIFSTILVSGLGFFVRRFYFYVDDFRGIQFYQLFDYMKSCFYRKNILFCVSCFYILLKYGQKLNYILGKNN